MYRSVLCMLSVAILLALAALSGIFVPEWFWQSEAQRVIGLALIVTAVLYVFVNVARERRRGVRVGFEKRPWLAIFGFGLIGLSFAWFFIFPKWFPHPGEAGSWLWIITFFVGALCGGILVGQCFFFRR